MVLSKHPFSSINVILEEIPSDAELMFSIYKYTPKEIVDTRTDFSILAKEITDSFISEKINSLHDEEELSICSLVTIKETTFHIPMIDLSTSSISQIKKLSPFIGENIANQMEWYFSGRSFHGYGTKLITNGEWIKLMGRLLLANDPAFPPIIDSRWIGHRLLAGYSSLRLSCNTKQYKQLPTRVTF